MGTNFNLFNLSLCIMLNKYCKAQINKYDWLPTCKQCSNRVMSHLVLYLYAKPTTITLETSTGTHITHDIRKTLDGPFMLKPLIVTKPLIMFSLYIEV